MNTLQLIFYLFMIYGTSFFLVYLIEISHEKLQVTDQIKDLIGGFLLGLLVVAIYIITGIVDHPTIPKNIPDGRSLLVLISVIYYGKFGGAITLLMLWLLSSIQGYTPMNFLLINTLVVYGNGLFFSWWMRSISPKYHTPFFMLAVAAIQFQALIVVALFMTIPDAKTNYYNGFIMIFLAMEIYGAMISLVFSHNRDRRQKIVSLQKAEAELEKNYITLKKKEEQIRQLAYFDRDTNLKSHLSFYEHSLKDGNRVVFLSISQFNCLCSTFGNEFERQAKKQFVEKVVKILACEKNLFYVGDGIFALVLENSLFLKTETIRKKFSDSFNEFITVVNYESYNIPIRQHIVILSYPNDGDTSEALYLHAKSVLGYAEQKGIFELAYTEGIFKRQKRSVNILNYLVDAVNHHELYTVYQPQYYKDGASIIGFEALARWESPELGPIYPDEFIHIAEEHGLIFAIDEQVFRDGCRFIKKYNLHHHTHATISINLSFLELVTPGLAERISLIIAEEDVPVEWLCLEITETASEDYWDLVMENTEKLLKLGIQLQLDDFGTGYSSLNYLLNIEAKIVKIDKALTSGIVDNHKSHTMMQSMLHMAQSFDLELIIEGVETLEQFELLKNMGFKYFQGYYFSKPMRPEAFLIL